MSVRYAVTVQDSAGNALIGRTVTLHNSGNANVLGTFTDNGDGTYYITVSASAKYDVRINGVLQDEMTGIYIPADDLPNNTALSAKADKVSGAVSGNLAGLNSSGNLIDSGYDPTDFLGQVDIIDTLVSTSAVDALSANQGRVLKGLVDADSAALLAHQNANGSGGSATPATNKVHNAAAIVIADAGARLSATDVEAALQELAGAGRSGETIKSLATLIGSMGLSSGEFIKDAGNITDALLMLNNQLYDLYLRGGDLNQSYRSKHLFVFQHNGTITNTWQYIYFGNVQTSESHGPVSPRDGSITAISLSWSAAVVESPTRQIGFIIYMNGIVHSSITIEDGQESLLKKTVYFPIGDNPVYAGSKLSVYALVSNNGSTINSISNPFLTVEVTLT